jgi:acyl-CoA thioesterase
MPVIHRLVVAVEWLTVSFEIDDSSGGIAVERRRITRTDGTLVAESFQTR